MNEPALQKQKHHDKYHHREQHDPGAFVVPPVLAQIFAVHPENNGQKEDREQDRKYNMSFIDVHCGVKINNKRQEPKLKSEITASPLLFLAYFSSLIFYMRIISGIYKGKVLYPPKNLPVRPTTDFARTGLFNILQHRFDLEEVSVIDLFAGTGSISLELASRGCRDIVSVDKYRGCTQFIQDTAKAWNIKGLKVIREDVFRFLQQCPYKADIIFADPPYDLETIADIPVIVFRKELLRPDGLLIIEHGDRTDLSAISQFTGQRRYGSVNFSLFGSE